MINLNPWERRNVTTKTTSWALNASLANRFAEASESDLEGYLDKLNKRISICETRGEIDVLNRLYWKIRFALEGKRAGKD
jgi:hypothetical protein